MPENNTEANQENKPKTTTKKPKSMEVCAFIFERRTVYQDDYTTVFSYTPIEVVNGKITDVKNNIFTAKKVRSLEGVENLNYNSDTGYYDFPILSDSETTDDKYVYGFPSVVTKSRNVTKTKKEMQGFVHDLKDYHIVQSLSRDHIFNKVFLAYGNSKLNIDDSDYIDFFEMFYGLSIDKVDQAIEILQENMPEHKEEKKKGAPAIIIKPEDILYSDDLYKEISATVKCQDPQIRAISTILAKNSRIKDPALKSNILLCGPTGCGKTEIFKTLQRKGIITLSIEDAGEYTATSYVGKSVTEMLAHMVKAADGDVEKAQTGVVAVDETDKKAESGQSGETYTTAVIDDLLPMMEGHQYHITLEKNGKEILFDTSRLTFVFIGAFSGIEKYAPGGVRIGFATDEDRAKVISEMYTDKTIQKYGLKPEFVGRNALIALNPLSEEALINIIKTSDKSQLLLFQHLLKDIGIDFIYDDKTIEAIAKKAVELKLGARSIKKIMEDALSVANYYVFSRNSYNKLIISPETIEDPMSFVLK